MVKAFIELQMIALKIVYDAQLCVRALHKAVKSKSKTRFAGPASDGEEPAI